MHVLFICGRELEYPRNDVLVRAFQRFSKVDVIACTTRPKSLFLNSLQIAGRAFPKILSRKYDLIFVGFYGHFLMLTTGWIARKPVLFDAFVSTYDTLTGDRQKISEKSIAAHAAQWLDRTSCTIARQVLLDTGEHCEYFGQLTGLPLSKFTSIPVGCNEDIFFPIQSEKSDLPIRVLYYSAYQPLHGVETVIHAAAILRDHPIYFRLIGNGQTYSSVRQLAESLHLANVEFIDPVPLQRLPQELVDADICLGGHFGLSEKAGRVVPGKIYQVLVMGRPLIAGDTPANRSLLNDGKDALLSPPGDPSQLASLIQQLADDPDLRKRLGDAARQLYQDKCSEQIITAQVEHICRNLVE